MPLAAFSGSRGKHQQQIGEKNTYLMTNTPDKSVSHVRLCNHLHSTHGFGFKTRDAKS